MLRLLAVFTALLTAGQALADDQKFVGTWHGISAALYTKLVIHDDKNITYCYVQSCRQQACWEWTIEGSTNADFSYQNELGRWEFSRADADTIEGEFTNAGGETSMALYGPE